MALSDTLLTTLPAIGTVAGGPVGGAVGGLASGILMGAQADKQKKAYQEAEAAIPLQDPGQVALLDQVRRDRQALRAGTDPMSTNLIGQIRNQGQQTAANLARNSGGNTGALTSNILRANEGSNRAIAGAGAVASQRADQLLNLQGSLTNSMADRLYNRQLSRANQLYSEYARKREDANRNTLAAIGMLPQASLNFSGGQQNFTGRMFDPTQPTRMESRIGGSALPYTPLG